MADATELVTLADLKTYLQITTATYDVILAAIKLSVETWVKTYCRSPFLIVEYTEYYDGNGGTSVHVQHYPITEIDEVNIDSDREFTADTEIDSDNIITSSQNNDQGVIELYDEAFSAGQKNVKVIYSAGYSVIPADLQLAVKIICGREFMGQDKMMSGMVSQNSGDRTITMSLDQIPRNAESILLAYKRAII